MTEPGESGFRRNGSGKEKAEARAREIKLREEAAKKAYEDMTKPAEK